MTTVNQNAHVVLMAGGPDDVLSSGSRVMGHPMAYQALVSRASQSCSAIVAPRQHTRSHGCIAARLEEGVRRALCEEAAKISPGYE